MVFCWSLCCLRQIKNMHHLPLYKTTKTYVFPLLYRLLENCSNYFLLFGILLVVMLFKTNWKHTSPSSQKTKTYFCPLFLGFGVIQGFETSVWMKWHCCINAYRILFFSPTRCLLFVYGMFTQVCFYRLSFMGNNMRFYQQNSLINHK